MDPVLKLLICMLIDFIGVASFAVPGLGEAADVGWAPISALLVNYLFGNGIFTALALVEELAPGFDIIPTATIAWILENANREEEESSFDTQQPPPPFSTTTKVAETPSKGKARESQDVIDVDIVD